MESNVASNSTVSIPTSVLQRPKQKVPGKTGKIEVYLDLLELVAGLGMALFVWMHLLFVSSILLGPQIFDALSVFLDKYYLAPIGIPITVLIFYVHAICAARKIPNKYSEFRITWNHAKMLGHTDTWIWVFQVITGIILFAFVSVHLWVIVSDYFVRFFQTGVGFYAVISAARVQGAIVEGMKGIGPSFLWFYAILIIICEYHVGFGLYRQFAKWGWVNYHTAGYVLKTISVLMVILAFITLGTLKTMALIPTNILIH